MRKKILAALTALLMLTGYSLPAFAEEISAPDTEQVSEDVQSDITSDIVGDDAEVTDAGETASSTENAVNDENTAADDTEPVEDVSDTQTADAGADTDDNADTQTEDAEAESGDDSADTAEDTDDTDDTDDADGEQTETAAEGDETGTEPVGGTDEAGTDVSADTQTEDTEAQSADDNTDIAASEENADVTAADDTAEDKDTAEDEETAEEELELYAGDWYTWDASTGTFTLKGQLPDTKIINEGLCGFDYYADIDRDKVNKIIIMPGTKSGRSMFEAFMDYSNLKSIEGLTNLDTSNATDMGGMFALSNSLTRIDASGFDTSNVTNMNAMFYGCTGLTSLNVSSFNTGNITDMGYMFAGCRSLTSLDLSGFDTSKVEYMNDMFNGCSSLTYLDVSSFNTSKVTSMRQMFLLCSSLRSLDVSGFDTGSVEDMCGMFGECSGLSSLDLSRFNTGSVMNMWAMFLNCSRLSTITVSDQWTTSSVTNSTDMFYGCTNLRGGNGTVYNSNVTDKTYARIDRVGAYGYLTGTASASVGKPTFTVTPGNASATVRWGAVSGATSYRVYRVENGSFIYRTETTSLSYSDTGLTNGKQYGYLVRAFKDGTGSAYTNSDIKYVTPVFTLAKPNFTVTAGNNSAVVSWSKVSGATSYRIYRVDNGKYVYLGEITGTSYTATGLTNGTKYGFLVRAFKDNSGSAYTSADIKYVTPVFTLAKPNFTVTAGNNSAVVSWSKVSGATSYRIYRVDNGKYTALANSTGTNYTATGLTNGTKYGFLVRAFKDGTGSAYTNSDIKYVTPVFTLAKPSFTVTAGNNSAVVSWSKVSGATSYRIYRVDNGKYTALANSTGTSYTATGLTNGTKYGFLVRAFKDGTGSAYTSADIKYVTPVFTLAKPNFTVTAGNDSAVINWSRVSGATSYRVYRVDNGKYVYLGAVTGTSYTATGLANGTEYSFLVRAFNGNSGSAYTSADVVYATPRA